jgi:HlyD family secretion protein
MKKPKVILAAAGAVITVSAAILIPSCRGTAPKANVVHLNGRIESQNVDLGPKVAGRVLEVRVKEGDRVKAGDVLVRLDLGETTIAVEREQAGVRSAEARVDDLQAGSRGTEIAAAEAEVVDRRAAVQLAMKESERQAFLLESNVAAPRDYDLAKTELDRAKAALNASQQRLALARDGFRRNQTAVARADADRAAAMLKQSEVVAREREIRAPADGVIVHRLAEAGQLIAAGQPAITMAFANRLYVRTFIPESGLGKVKMGASARISVDAFPGRAFEARITEISPDAEFTPKSVETKTERVNLVYAAKADLVHGWKEPLVPGQPADIEVDAAN